jgi:hypothetical protein
MNTSTVGPYVRDIKPAPGGIQVVQCNVAYQVEHHDFSFWNFIGWDNDDKDEVIKEGNCVQQVVPTEVAP